MNLRQKIFLSILLIFISVMGIGIILARVFFLESFRVLEQEEIRIESESFHYLLNDELEKLTALASDWSMWDDTYQFIKSGSQSYVESNLVDSTFLDFGLSYVVMLDIKNQIIYETAYDLVELEFKTPEDNIRQAILSLIPKMNDSNVSGYLSVDRNLLLFAASPILTSNGTGPSRGYLVFVRDFDGDIADHLSSATRSDFRIHPYGSLNLNDYKVAEYSSTFFYDDRNRETIQFITFIDDHNGDHIFEVEFILPRLIYQRGLASMRDLLISIGFAGLLASVCSIIVLEKGFISRLARLTAGIKQFDGRKEDETKKIILVGKDELSTLSTDIYQALISLAQTRDDLAEHLALEKLLVNISTKFINLPLDEIDYAINHVLETIGKFAGVDRSYILIINEENPNMMSNTHEWCSSGTPSVLMEMQDIMLENYGWWYRQMTSGRSIFIDDLDLLPQAAAAEKEIFSHQNIKSIANIPFYIGGKLAGAIGFDAVKKKINWKKEGNILLKVVSGIIANAIDRQRHESRLNESLSLHQRRSEELNALRDTITDITSELEIKKLLQTILKRSVKLLNADGGEICIFDKVENALQVVSIVNMNQKYLNTEIYLGEGAAGLAASKRQPIILEDYSNWESKIKAFEDAKIRSVMVTPLMVGDRLLGTLGIFHYSVDKQFSEADLHLLTLFAQHASIALDNAILFEKIHELARIDELTGLLNRRSFIERAEYELNRAKRLNHPLSMAMIDLDDFKQVNDRFSHQVGDRVLYEISELLSSNLRNIDIISRYGGDEFIVLMPETSLENAKIVLQRLNMNLAEHQYISGEKSFNKTASIGLVSFSNELNSLEKMISAADKSMYQAKNTGKSQLST